MSDHIRVCFLCGEVMDDLTKEQIKMFGKPKCCESEMVKVPSKNIHAIIAALDKVRINLEKELVKDFGCDQYVK